MSKRLNVSDYIKLATFNNVLFVSIILILTRLGCNVYFTNSLALIGLGLVGAMLLNGFFAVLNFWPAIILQNFRKKPRQKVVEKVVPTPAKVESDPPTLPELTDMYASPYLKRGVEPTKLTVDGKAADLYSFVDIKFDFYKNPHVLLAGTSGSGKTNALYNIINVLKQQYETARFVLIDYGAQDFTQTYPTDLQTFLDVTEQMFYIMKGRQKEGRDEKRTRIIWIVEEFESVLGEIGLLPKEEQRHFLIQLVSIGRMARKIGINMVFITQSAKAADFDTNLRNNFGSRFVMRLENSHLVSNLGCPFDVGSLPTGVAYNNSIRGFVEFPLAKEPKLDLIPQSELRRLANLYKRKYELTANG